MRVISTGRPSMSSRWISTSLRRPATSFSRLIAACAALTSDDFPMPRAPHRSALLAGRPRAKRWVFSTRRSRTRSIPRRSERSTRLTRATGANAPRSARQIKASASSKSGFAGAAGTARSSASAMRRRRSAWLSRGGKGNPVQLRAEGVTRRTQAPEPGPCRLTAVWYRGPRRPKWGKPMASTPPTLITPKFVFSYPLSPNVSDYRCVVNADATAVIVERTVLGAGGEQPNLYIADLLGGSATPFLKSINDIPIGETTRPDWCWRTGQVAFNYTKSPKVGVVDATGANPRLFPNTATMNYPTWFPDGDKLATESGQGSPDPNTTTLDPKTGSVIKHAREGTNLYGGMPSVNPVNRTSSPSQGRPSGHPTIKTRTTSG